MSLDHLPGIDHVILLMFENRSFDNMLGGFYTGEAEGGGVPAGWSNPWPGNQDVKAWQAPVDSASQNIPYPDPNESFLNMSQQINNHGKMRGFVADYAAVKHASPPDIMQFFSADNVPVTYALATAYAASDRYFASGPVQTWPNRLFSLCGTPGFRNDRGENRAYLDNPEYPGYPLIKGQLDWPNIFQRLDEQGQTWRVYFDGLWPICALIKYVYEHWHWLAESHVLGFEDAFFADVEAGTLPTFSLIEPRYQDLSDDGYKAPNSNHPGSSSALSETSTPINVSCGERFLARIYNALARQPALFDKTLLVVTYDEHGGLFDHVYPPPAVPPFDASDNIQGFDYDQYGVRVPTLLINPRVQRGLYRPPGGVADAFDHTSLLQTLTLKYGLGPLTPRVTAATPFSDLIDPAARPRILPPVDVPECNWGGEESDRHGWAILRSALADKRPRYPNP